MTNGLNGFILTLRQNCSLGGKGQLISTHATLNEAVEKAHSMQTPLSYFQIKDIFQDLTYTAK